MVFYGLEFRVQGFRAWGSFGAAGLESTLFPNHTDAYRPLPDANKERRGLLCPFSEGGRLMGLGLTVLGRICREGVGTVEFGKWCYCCVFCCTAGLLSTRCSTPASLCC